MGDSRDGGSVITGDGGALGDLAVEESGPIDAPLVVLVHGSMDRMAGFAKVARRLESSYRVVRYDRRGYGRSVGHPGPFRIADHTSDLAEIIGRRRAAIVGHSLGGNVALGVAHHHPHLVAAAAVYETPLSWMPWWPKDSSGRQIAASNEDPAELAERFLRNMIGNRRWERLPETSRSARRAEGRALVGEMISVRDEAPWEAERITCPLTIGRGELARPHQAEGMLRLSEMVPASTFVTLPGCNHMAHAGEPDLFVDRLVLPMLATARW